MTTCISSWRAVCVQTFDWQCINPAVFMEPALVLAKLFQSESRSVREFKVRALTPPVHVQHMLEEGDVEQLERSHRVFWAVSINYLLRHVQSPMKLSSGLWTVGGSQHTHRNNTQDVEIHQRVLECLLFICIIEPIYRSGRGSHLPGVYFKLYLQVQRLGVRCVFTHRFLPRISPETFP